MLLAPGGDGWLQIIGVVGDSLNDGLQKPVAPAVYVPDSLILPRWTQILVRTQGDPLIMLHSIRQQVASIDSEQQVFSRVEDLEQWIERDATWARARLVSILFAAFSVLALILSVVGLYSVMSYTVVQRTTEFGIRMALGAGRSHVIRIVMLSAGTSVGIGIVVGVGMSFGLSRLMTRWIEQGVRDPGMIVAASLLMIAVAALACLAPARRAATVDPMTSLRCD
jgi:ABC-type antimicrobial peptide transport system permease subunit